MTFPTSHFGKFSNFYGLNFDGVNKDVNIPDNATLRVSILTLSVWLNTSSVGNYAGIIEKFSLQNTGYSININTNGGLRADLGNGVGYITPVTALDIRDSKWHHVVVTYDNATAILYVDNVNKSSVAGVGYAAASAVPLYLGFDPTGPNRYFNGLLEEVSIWNAAFTPAQVEELWNHGRSKSAINHSKAANLVGWWRMGDGATWGIKWTIPDDSVNSNTGTSENMVQGDRRVISL